MARRYSQLSFHEAHNAIEQSADGHALVRANLRHLGLRKVRDYKDFTGRDLIDSLVTEYLIYGQLPPGLSQTTLNTVHLGSQRLTLSAELMSDATLRVSHKHSLVLHRLFEIEHTGAVIVLPDYYSTVVPNSLIAKGARNGDNPEAQHLAIQSNCGYCIRNGFCIPELVCDMINTRPLCSWRPTTDFEHTYQFGLLPLAHTAISSSNIVIADRQNMALWTLWLTALNVKHIVVKSAAGIRKVQLIEASSLPPIILVCDVMARVYEERNPIAHHLAEAFVGVHFQRVFYDSTKNVLSLFRFFNASFHWFFGKNPKVYNTNRLSLRDYQQRIEEATTNLHTFSAILSKNCSTIIQAFFTVRPSPDFAKSKEFACLPTIRRVENLPETLRQLISSEVSSHNPGPKILFSIEGSLNQQELGLRLAAIGVPYIILTSDNITTFSLATQVVGISRLIYDLDLSYLTHLFIADESYSMAQLERVLIRAHRQEREEALQVISGPLWFLRD